MRVSAVCVCLHVIRWIRTPGCCPAWRSCCAACKEDALRSRHVCRFCSGGISHPVIDFFAMFRSYVLGKSQRRLLGRRPPLWVSRLCAKRCSSSCLEHGWCGHAAGGCSDFATSAVEQRRRSVGHSLEWLWAATGACSCRLVEPDVGGFARCSQGCADATDSSRWLQTNLELALPRYSCAQYPLQSNEHDSLYIL